MKKSLKTIALSMLLCCHSQHTMSQRSPLIKFGIIADVQYADCETQGSRFYRNSLQKLEDCVSDLNKEKVPFTINLGDLIDRDIAHNMDSVLLRLNKLNGLVYNIPGNHDYQEGVKNATLYRILNMTDEYYAFKKKNWRFILLNTNEISSYANNTDTWKQNELSTMLAHIETTGKNNGQPWNGGISSKQLEWLKKQLNEAQKANQNTVIFSHHPLYPPIGLTALNDDEILELIADYSCVKAIISGHHHTGAYGEYKNIPCITLEGMVETEDVNAYGIIYIYENELILTGKGRTKSYTIPLN